MAPGTPHCLSSPSSTLRYPLAHSFFSSHRESTLPVASSIAPWREYSSPHSSQSKGEASICTSSPNFFRLGRLRYFFGALWLCLFSTPAALRIRLTLFPLIFMFSFNTFGQSVDQLENDLDSIDDIRLIKQKVEKILEIEKKSR